MNLDKGLGKKTESKEKRERDSLARRVGVLESSLRSVLVTIDDQQKKITLLLEREKRSNGR